VATTGPCARHKSPARLVQRLDPGNFYLVLKNRSDLGNESCMKPTSIYSAQRKATYIYRSRDPRSCGVRAQLYLPRLPIRPPGGGEPFFRLESIVYTECDDCSPQSKQPTPIDQRARGQSPGAVQLIPPAGPLLSL
jgi:hypothetical protein